MLTLVPQQKRGPAYFSGDLGKGCEAISLVPFLALLLQILEWSRREIFYGEIVKPLLKDTYGN